MADELTYLNLRTEVKRAIKSLGTSKDTIVDMVINQVYLTEILQIDELYPLFWLLDFDEELNWSGVGWANVMNVTDFGRHQDWLVCPSRRAAPKAPLD